MDQSAAGPFRQAAALAGAAPSAWPSLGASVAVAGDRAIAGAPGRYDRPETPGSVYVFRRLADGAWQQEGVLAAPAGADWAFGRSVALAGSLAAVADSSSVYLFGLGAGAAPRTVLSGVLVRSVALAGGTLAVGLLAGDEEAPAVRVYQRDQGGAGAWGLAATLVPADAGFGFTYHFGSDLGLSGDGRSLIVSNSGAADQYYEDASALLYARGDDGGWALEKVLAPPQEAGGDGWSNTTFGWTVDVDGDVAVVGSLPIQGGSTSTLHVFERDEGGPDNWGEVARFELASPEQDGVVPMSTGRTVAVAGGSILAGAYASGCFLEDGQDLPCGPGIVEVFRRNVQTGAWTKTQELQADGARPDQQFARALAFDGHTAVVGARGLSGESEAAVFVFER